MPPEEKQRQEQHRAVGVTPIRDAWKDLAGKRFGPSPTYNISIQAMKQVRLTPTEDMPGWLGSTINYLTPVTASLWLSQAVEKGAWTAIRAAKESRKNDYVRRAAGLGWYEVAANEGPRPAEGPPAPEGSQLPRCPSEPKLTAGGNG